MTMNGMFDDKPKPPTLDGMIACAKRELAMRKNVYPRWVKAGKMKQHSADNELRNMQGIVDCLTKLKEAAAVGEYPLDNLMAVTSLVEEANRA